MALVVVGGCSSPLAPDQVVPLAATVNDASSTPGAVAPPVIFTPPVVVVKAPAAATTSCEPTISPTFPISHQAERVARQIIGFKKKLRETSTYIFHMEEVDATKRPIEGHYTARRRTRMGTVEHFKMLPGWQSVDRREIAAGVIRWSTDVNLDILIKGVAIAECLPQAFGASLHLDLQ